MASARKRMTTKVEVVQVTKEVQDGATIELNNREVVVLVAILNSIGGPLQTSFRSVSEQILRSLSSIINTDTYTNPQVQNVVYQMLEGKSSIYFKHCDINKVLPE